ncbi:MAG: hypothetical protein RRY79_04710 [Clostridia bacterium]
MLVIIIGVVVGATALYLLALSTTAILRNEPQKAALPLLANIFLIAIALLGTAFLAHDRLVFMGIGLAAGLIVGAIIKLILGLRKDAMKKKESADLTKDIDEEKGRRND